MSNKLWIPPHITPTADLVQLNVCQQMQDELDLSKLQGGCYGISCPNCILDNNNVKAFDDWKNNRITQSSHPEHQADLF